MKIYVLPYIGNLEAVYQVTGNYTVKQQSFVTNVPQLFEFFLLWKSKIYLYTSTIRVSVYVRLTVFLRHPHGIHIHDGPGMESDQVNCNRNVIHFSSFQAFVVAFTNTWTAKYQMYPADFGLNHKGREIN